MFALPKQTSRYALVFLLAAMVCTIPQVCLASRYHVKSTGTRFSGTSTPNDWSDPNCYPAIHLAAGAAAVTDSILLFNETHNLGQLVAVPRFIGNQDLDANSGNTTLAVSSLGRLKADGSFPHLAIRGISFVGDSANSNFAVIEITNTGGLLSQVFIEDCDFENLRSSDNGGFLAGGGAAIRADGDGGGAYIDIRDCRFTGNQSRGGGGAIFIGDNYDVYFSDSIFQDNLADHGIQVWDGRGGAIYLLSNNVMSNLTLVDCLVVGNTALGPGGGLFVEGGSLAMYGTDLIDSRSAFEGSTGWSAGAGLFMRGNNGHNQTMRLEMWDCIVNRNKGDISVSSLAGDGGGVLVKGISGQMVDVHVAQCRFEENFNAQGAGLYIGRFTTGEVERCSFRNNIAFYNGGGSYKGGAFAENLGETVVYNYCEFVGNRAGYYADGTEAEVDARGGGFCTRLYPRAFFYNCTFLQNKVSSFAGLSDAFYMWRDGGQFDDDQKRCRLINCVFFGNNGNDIQVNNLENAFQVVTHCAFGEGQFITPGVTPEATVLLGSNPCVSIVDSTLLPGSSCIDAALPVGLLEDLAGDLVPQGSGPDIGAREFPQVTSPATQEGDLPQTAMHSVKVWPNPFNPQTRISFSLEQPMNIAVKVFDLRGNLVRSLFEGQLSAGIQNLSWNGCDDNDRQVASGTYFAVIKGGGRPLTARMALVR